MIDKATGQVEPCPMCGSREVRWRPRRLYDFVFTWFRYVVETVLQAVGFGRLGPQTLGGASGSMPVCDHRIPNPRPGRHIDDIHLEMQYSRLRQMYELNTGTATANRYWKCRSCRRRGQVFDGLADLVRPLGELTRMEDAMTLRHGAPSNPVDRDAITPPR
jgi:hypothetical protein